jgi:hypothetical protein
MRAILALAMLVAFAGAAFAEDPVTERARATYKFDAWPGRAEAPRDGIDLRAIELAGVKRTQLGFSALPNGPVATVGFANDTFARVWVEETAAAAHEVLLSFLAASAGRLERLSGPSTRGDVSFGAKDTDGEVLAFARANVCVRISGSAAGHVAALAKRFEELIAASPILDGSRPRSAVEVARISGGPRGTSVALETRGEVLSRSGFAAAPAIPFVDGSAIAFLDDDLVLRTKKRGTYTVTVHLLSTRGWRTTARTDVRVE